MQADIWAKAAGALQSLPRKRCTDPRHLIYLINLTCWSSPLQIVCLDLEGVLVPEIWIEFAERSGIPELAMSRITTS